jgi:hypothetical protein
LLASLACRMILDKDLTDELRFDRNMPLHHR